MADPALEALANLLKTTQARRTMENRPATPPVSVQPNTANFGAMAGPQAMGAAMPMAAPPTISPPPPANQPAAVAAAPPMSPTDGPQPLQPMPPPVNISATGANPAISTSIWDTLKRMLANGQVPEGYRGAMGEMIKNT